MTNTTLRYRGKSKKYKGEPEQKIYIKKGMRTRGGEAKNLREENLFLKEKEISSNCQEINTAMNKNENGERSKYID